MNTFSIKHILSSYRKTKPSILLGRWSVQYDQRIIDQKINQANEDHCGCCVTESTETKATSLAKKTRDEKRDEYLLPYVM
jgi:hypothetical protein